LKQRIPRLHIFDDADAEKYTLLTQIFRSISETSPLLNIAQSTYSVVFDHFLKIDNTYRILVQKQDKTIR